MSNTCINCEWWSPIDNPRERDDVKLGFCNFNPPVPIATTVDERVGRGAVVQRTEIRQIRPRTRDWDRCSKFEQLKD